MIEYKQIDSSNEWVLFKRRVPIQEVKLRVFFFPPAGSDIVIYNSFEKYLPTNVEMALIMLPGRGKRQSVPLRDNCYELASEIIENIKQYLEEPYIFFGHSMGTLIAHEVANQIYSQGLAVPQKLFLSGMKTPDCIGHKEKCFQGIMDKENEYLYLLDDKKLENKIYEIGGIPDAFKEEKEFMKALLPIFRNDLKLCETIEGNEIIQLPIPIEVYGGSDDKIVSKEQLLQWKAYSQKSVKVTMFKGGHFYFNEITAFFMMQFSRSIQNIINSI